MGSAEHKAAEKRARRWSAGFGKIAKQLDNMSCDKEAAFFRQLEKSYGNGMVLYEPNIGDAIMFLWGVNKAFGIRFRGNLESGNATPQINKKQLIETSAVQPTSEARGRKIVDFFIGER